MLPLNKLEEEGKKDKKGHTNQSMYGHFWIP